MPLIPLKPVLDYARDHQFAHGAFNVNMAVQAKAVIEIHETFRSAAILQGAEPSNAFFGGQADFLNGTRAEKQRGAARLGSIVSALAAQTDLPIVLHLDHGKSLEMVQDAIAAGYTSVMIDGSALNYADNVALTREVVRYAHSYGVSVEAELGILSGVEDNVFAEESTYTNPNLVCDFFKKTGCDFLAISYGTMHGIAKGVNVKLRNEIVIAAMENMRHEHIDGALVSHGSSTIPAALVTEINHLGGHIKKAGGISIAELNKAIAAGISKINIDSDIRLTVTRNLRMACLRDAAFAARFPQVWQALQANPAEVDPRVYLASVMPLLISDAPAADEYEARLLAAIRQAVLEAVGQLVVEFGAVGDAFNIEQKTLEQMADFYKKRGD